MNTAVAPSSPLTAADRCDRCGAQAYLRVELQSGGELLFCAHHAREHGDKLKEIAVTLVDETDKLTDTTPPLRVRRRGADPRVPRLQKAPDPDGSGAFCLCERVDCVTGVEVLVALAIAVGLVGILVPILPGSILVLAAILVWAWDVGGTTAWVVFGVGGRRCWSPAAW